MLRKIIYDYAKIFFFALIICQKVYQYIDYKDDVDLHEKLAEWEAFYIVIALTQRMLVKHRMKC